MTKFRELQEGTSFDFIGPDWKLVSFYLRCKKVSARKYVDEKSYIHRVGTINCEVHNIDESGKS
jgi:hypothetical protein